MNITAKWIIVALLSTVSMSSVYAAEQSVPPVPAKQQPLSCPDQASIMPAISDLSRKISLALLMVGNNQLQVSAGHIAEAENQLDQLIENKPVISASDQLRMVRLEYQQDKVNHFILLPFDGQTGLQEFSGLANTIPKESKIVTMHMVIDGSKVKTVLEQAWQALAANDKPKVAASLQEALVMIGNAEIAERPNYLKITYDYMLLTDSLLKNGLSGYARFSLEHIKTNLKNYASSTHDPKRNMQLTQLKLNIDILSEQLDQQTPATLEKAKTQVKGWMKSVKEWLKTESDAPYDKVQKG